MRLAVWIISGLLALTMAATIASSATGTPGIAVQTVVAGLLSALVAWARSAGPARIEPRGGTRSVG